MALKVSLLFLFAFSLLADTMDAAYPPEKSPYPPKKAPTYPPKKAPIYPPKKAPVYPPKKAPVHPPKKAPAPDKDHDDHHHHHHHHHHHKAPAPEKLHHHAPPPVKVPPVHYSAPSKAPVPMVPACVPLCEYHCKAKHGHHEHIRECMKACTACCEKSKCVPKGTQKCSNWDYVITKHGEKLTCP